jgi:hypothetical protein
VFFGGVRIFAALGRASIFEQPAARLADRGDREAPYRRFRGYNAAALQRYFSGFDRAAFEAFRRTLQADLLFPLFYGGAIAAALFIGTAHLQHPFPSAWIPVLTLLPMAADWTENVSLLRQLPRFESGEAPDERAVALASAATRAKLWLLVISFGAACAVAVAVALGA